MDNKFNLTVEENVFLAKKLLVGSIYSSAKIEGVNTTFPELKTNEARGEGKDNLSLAVKRSLK